MNTYRDYLKVYIKCKRTLKYALKGPKSHYIHGNRTMTPLHNKLNCQITTRRHNNDQHILIVDRRMCVCVCGGGKLML